MKKSLNKKFGIVFTLLFAFAPLAHAAVISGTASKIEADSEVTHSDIEVNTKTTATPVTGEHMEGGVNTAAGIRKMEDRSDGGKDESSEHGTSTKLRGVENAQTHANENAGEALGKAELHFSAGGTGDNNEDSNSTSSADVSKAADVHSEIDLKQFIAHKSKSDAHIKSVDVRDGTVEVGYEESGKWFGFLSGKVEAKASADVRGNVDVTYPWYHIFMNSTHSSASLQSEIARALAAEKKSEKESVSSTTVRANVSAAFAVPNLFEIIANTLRKASASATAETEVKTN